MTSPYHSFTDEQLHAEIEALYEQFKQLGYDADSLSPERVGYLVQSWRAVSDAAAARGLHNPILDDIGPEIDLEDDLPPWAKPPARPD